MGCAQRVERVYRRLAAPCPPAWPHSPGESFVTLGRTPQPKLAICSSVLVWLAAPGCASTCPSTHAANAIVPASSRGYRAHDVVQAQTIIRRLIDAGQYPAAESAAAGLITSLSAAVTDPSRIADALDLLVEAMVSGGRCWEPRAHDALQRSLAIRQREPGPDSLDLAGSLFLLGRLREERWDDRGAIEAYERSLSLRRRALGPEHPQVMAAIRHISLAWMNATGNHFAEAESLRGACTAVAERTLAAEHPDRIESDYAVAMIARNRGSLDTTRFATVAERTERVFGPDHPVLAERPVMLSERMRGAAHHARAQQLLTWAHGIYERQLGPRNLLTART